MSADDYGVVHPHGGGWGLSMGFASDEHELELDRPYFTGTFDEVIDYANKEYFEYGYRVVRDVKGPTP